MPAKDLFSPRNTLVLYNPVSGRREAQRNAAALVKYLGHHGYHVIHTQASGGYIREYVGEFGDVWTSLICIGGDGTLLQAIAGIPPHVPIGFFPAGTINLLAHSVSVPKSVDAWLDLLQRGTTRDLYFGQANGHPFVSVGSVGFDAWIVSRVSSRLKHWLHEGAYGIQAIWELPRYKVPTYNVVIDGRKIDENILGVLVGKGPYFAGPYSIFKNADHRVPKLSVVLLKGVRKSRLLRYAYGLVRGHFSQIDGVMMYSADQVVVETNIENHVEVDGEPLGLTPVTFTVDPVPRKVLAP